MSFSIILTLVMYSSVYITGNGGTRIYPRKAVAHYLSMDYFVYRRKIICMHSDGKLQIGKT